MIRITDPHEWQLHHSKGLDPVSRAAVVRRSEGTRLFVPE
jgi:hypothetical protein